MRDIVVLVFVLLCIGFALRKPWYGVLALAVFSYLSPHTYAWGFATTLPLYQVLLMVVVASTIMANKSERQLIPNDWRVTTFYMLWFYYFITTTQAYVPDAAWARLWTVSKIYIPFIFTLILINNREKLFALLATIAASIGVVAFKGGVFAVLSGFAHRVYGPPRSEFYENNAFAVAVLINIPLVILWYKESKNPWIKRLLPLSIPFMFASALSSWSRGGLVTLVALLLMLIWQSKRKWLAVPLVAIGITVAIPNLPDEWFGRMQTLETVEEDKSASTRLMSWQDGWKYALRNPVLGVGFDGWRIVSFQDWHSSYLEILAEHGFIAFGMWLALIIGSVITLTRLPRQMKGVQGMEWVANYSYAVRMSIICYMIGTAFLSLAMWDLLYHLIFVVVLIKKFAMEELEEKRKAGLLPVPVRAW